MFDSSRRHSYIPSSDPALMWSWTRAKGKPELFCGVQDTTWVSLPSHSLISSYFPPSHSPWIHNTTRSTSCWINNFHRDSISPGIEVNCHFLYFFLLPLCQKSVHGAQKISHKGQLMLACRSKLCLSLSSFILHDNTIVGNSLGKNGQMLYSTCPGLGL